MGEAKTKQPIYEDAKTQHTSLDRRLQMLLKKPYLTEKEELEMRVLKKKKLYYKDIMERISEEPEEGEKV
jgi:hypothetical protein